MLKRLKSALTDKYISIKATVKANKIIILIFCAVVLLGIISGIVSFAGAIGDYEGVSIAESLANNEFNYILFYLKIVLFPALILAAGLLLSLNKIVFCGNFLIMFFYVRQLVKSAMLKCFIGGFYGFLFFFIYYLPLFLIDVVLIIAFLTELYNLALCGCKWKYVTPLKCNLSGTSRLLKRYLVAVLIFNLVFSSVIILIFSLIL